MADDPSSHEGAHLLQRRGQTTAAAAEEALAAGRYREAVRLYRLLSRTEPEAVWLQGLAEAYRQRALELESKGMPEEARAIWANREACCPGVPPEPEALRLLLELGDGPAAAEAYARLSDTAPAEGTEALRARLAAAALADSATFEALPSGSPLREQGVLARSALADYCAGRDDEAAEALQQLPYRSPYRDLALTLKALLVSNHDPGAARQRLARVPADSPFAGLADAARWALLPEDQLISDLAQAPLRLQRLVGQLRGWPPARLDIWQRLFADGFAPDAERYHLLAGLDPATSGDWVRHYRLREAYRQGGAIPAPAAHAPEGPSELEHALLAAWRAEGTAAEDPFQVLDAWQRVIELLRRSPLEAGNTPALRVALLQRHLALELGLLDGPCGAEAEAALAESVTLDPEHVPGHLALIRHYRAQGRLDEAREAAAAAVEHAPRSVALRHEALACALEAGALAEAADLARGTLALDPLDHRARGALYDALLAHGRLSAADGDPETAMRTLDEAQAWCPDDRRGELDRARAILAHLHQPDRGSREALVEMATETGDAVSGGLSLALEAERQGADAQALLAELRLTPPRRLERTTLLALADTAAEAAAHAPAGARRRALEPFRRAFRRSLRDSRLGLGDYEHLCEALRTAGEDELRLACAREAQRLSLEAPFAIGHALEARYPPGAERRPTRRELDQLERAYRRARGSGETRTTYRLANLIRRLFPAPG